MKHLQLLNPINLDYPVGVNLSLASEIALEMAKSFKKIKEFKNKDINLCCMGSSGAIMASLFFTHLKWSHRVNVVHIKKTGELAHSSDFCCFYSQGITVIIDDFSESGKTLNTIYQRLCNYKGTVYKDAPLPVIDCVIIQSFRFHGIYKLRFKPNFIISRNI